MGKKENSSVTANFTKKTKQVTHSTTMQMIKDENEMAIG